MVALPYAPYARPTEGVGFTLAEGGAEVEADVGGERRRVEKQADLLIDGQGCGGKRQGAPLIWNSAMPLAAIQSRRATPCWRQR